MAKAGQSEAVLRVEGAGQDAGHALEHHRHQCDAHQRGRELALLVARKASADHVHQRLGERSEDDGDDDEGQRRQAEDGADQAPELALVAQVLDEDRHEGRRGDAADEHVVGDIRQRAGEDEGVGARGWSEVAAMTASRTRPRPRERTLPRAITEAAPSRRRPGAALLRCALESLRWTWSMALLARFACGCTRRVEIPAPVEVRCAEHRTIARLIATPRGQVRYVTLPAQSLDDTPPTPAEPA